MIGQRVESRQGLPWGALAVASIGLAMAACGLALGRVPLLTASAAPIAIAFALLVSGRERPFAAVFGEHAIELDGPGGPVPYGSLRDVRAAGIPHEPSSFRKPSARLHVEHEGGAFEIPPRLNAPSHDVYRFLAGRIPPNGGRAVDPALAEYLEQQERSFGPDQVWTYRAAGRRSRRDRYRRLRACCLGLIAGGVAWMVAGFSGLVDAGWGGAGILCSALGLCFFLATLANNDGPVQYIKNWKNASLVIGPQGLAMVQGDIQGEVRWAELLEVRFKPKKSAFRLTQARGLNGIILRVKGAEILIADLYDRPLYLIHDRILVASGRAGAGGLVGP